MSYTDCIGGYIPLSSTKNQLESCQAAVQLCKARAVLHKMEDLLPIRRHRRLSLDVVKLLVLSRESRSTFHRVYIGTILVHCCRLRTSKLRLRMAWASRPRGEALPALCDCHMSQLYQEQ